MEISFSKKERISYLNAITGSLLFAIGINLFLVPAGLYSGGFMGIGQVIRTVLERYLGFKVESMDIAGIIYYIINIPMFILAYLKIGKGFFIKTIVVVTLQTVFLSIIPTNMVIMKNDPFVSAVLAGAITGYAVGIQLREGSAGGGQDILGIYVMKNNSNFSVGKVSLIVNVVVFTSTLIMYDISTVVYSLLFVVVNAFVADRVHLQNVNIKATIITEHAEDVKAIIENNHRSTTIMSGRGGYAGKQYDVVFTVLSKFEARELEKELISRELAVFAEFSAVDHIMGDFPKHL